MSWNNYGFYWSIDHVIPMAYFNLVNQNSQKICCNWTNMQPLMILENQKKSAT